MVLDMKVNGMKKRIKEMAEGTKFGQMVLFMRDTGKMIKQTVEED